MRRIIIVGGGFAGTTLARRLIGRTPNGWEVILISEESYTTYNPLLSEVVGASIFPEHAIAPLREVIGAHKIGRFVVTLDLRRRAQLHRSWSAIGQASPRAAAFRPGSPT